MKKPSFSLEEAHRYFGVRYNNGTWELLEKENRTHAEDVQLVHGAHASLSHWLESRQRGQSTARRMFSVFGALRLGGRIRSRASRRVVFVAAPRSIRD